jgi:hypothetical protein
MGPGVRRDDTWGGSEHINHIALVETALRRLEDIRHG